MKFSWYERSALAVFYTVFRAVSRIVSHGRRKVGCASEVPLVENK